MILHAHAVSPENERFDIPTVVRRRTERHAISEAELNAWMQKRVDSYGEPGLTYREHQAITYSLHLLPTVAFDESWMNHRKRIELPTQVWIGEQMGLTQGRVSRLLNAADQVIRWFEQQGRGHEIYWKRQNGKEWEFVAPILGPRLPTERLRVVKNMRTRTYELAFAGLVKT